MKKTVSVLLALFMLLSLLSGCGAGEKTYPEAAKEEIFTKTIHDFDNLRVENLDEQEDTNFLVYAEGVKEITVTKNTNTLLVTNYEDLAYTFANADETLRSLKKGDILFAKATAENPEVVAAKVKRIKAQDDKVLVYSDPIGLADLFVYADVMMEVLLPEDAETTSTRFSQENSAYISNLTHSTREDAHISNLASYTVPVNITRSHDLQIKQGPVEATGKLSVTVKTVFLEWRFSREHMQLFCGIWADYDTVNDVTLTAAGDLVDYSNTLAKIPLRWGPFNILLEPIAHVKVSGELSGSINHTESRQVGFTADVSSQDVRINPVNTVLSPATITGKLETAEASVELGIEIKPSLPLGFIGSIYGSGYLGVEATGTLVLPEAPQEGEYPDSIHSCESCIDGDVFAVGRISAGLNIAIDFSAKDKEDISKQTQELIGENQAEPEEDTEEEEENEPLEVTLLEPKAKFADFYLSLDGAEPPFGWGECPNIRYKTTVTVQTTNQQPAADAKLSAELSDGTAEQLSTGQDGTAILYLPNGETHFVSTQGIQYGSADITVEQAPTNASILLHDRKLSIMIGCKNIDSGERYPAQSAFPEMYELFYQRYPGADFTASLDLTDGDIQVLVVSYFQEQDYGFIGSEELIMTTPYTCLEILTHEYRTDELDSFDIFYNSVIDRDWQASRVIGDSPSLWWFDEGSPHWDISSRVFIRDIDILEEVAEEEPIAGYTYVYEFLSDREYCHNRLLQFAPTAFPYIDAMMEGRLAEMVDSLTQ